MTVSVVIPVLNGAAMMAQVLPPLMAGSVRPKEVIVVDDGSTDGSAAMAESFGCLVHSSGERQGPARARNLGAKHATGEILLFLDADVVATSETVARVQAAFEDPALDALIGSYDDKPSAPDFLSQYKNLMHHYAHQSGRSEASTFWSGCGAIRRQLFLDYSGFDECYKRPAIEDIELGYRLVRDGKRILLDRDLKVKHLKRWSFFGLLKTDILDRGIPWTELILRDRRMPNDLNIQLSQRVSVALVYVALALAAFSAIRWHALFLTPFLGLLFVITGLFWTDPGAPRPRWASGAFILAIGGFCAMAWWTGMFGLIPVVLLGIPALMLRHRYQRSEGVVHVVTRVLSAVLLLAGLAATLYYAPAEAATIGLGAVLAVILILNQHFYVFLAGKRGKYFALAAIPFHLLYHFYNGVSFAIGFVRYWLRRKD